MRSETHVHVFERHGVVALAWPHLSTVPPALVPPCHKLSLTSSNLSPADPNPHHPSPLLTLHEIRPARPLLHKPQRRTQLSVRYDRNLFFSLFLLFTSQSDVERSVLTLKVGYRNITGFVLKAVRGKRQINTFHIPPRWSVIDQGLHIAMLQPAWCVVPKHAILIRERHFMCLTSLLSMPSTTLRLPPALLSFPILSSPLVFSGKSGSIHRTRV